ncbi:MAG TPA: cytochrome b N-terminal domain-containing protein, partial [Microlunatus sp.]|nr:cytochrome b N-terminal domain-containing protein [Microlunatus sp.]
MSSRERRLAVAEPGGAPFRRADGTPWGSGLIRSLKRRPTRPVHDLWPSLIDAIAVGCLLMLIITGAILAIFYTPSSTLVRYHGSYPLLRGVEMSQAYASTLAISFDLSGGLLLRQTHHWAALILPAALMLRLLLAFFTGAFRTPRRPQWLLSVAAFLTALLGGWSGYALPDDLLAGTGLRIFQGVLLGIPVIGTWLSLVLFGGEYPGDVLARIYPIHLAAPVVLVALLVARARLARRGRPDQGDNASPRNGQPGRVVGWSTRTVEWLGMVVITSGVLITFGGLVEISPVWRQGPSTPGAAGAGSQPDWYTAFLDGALRLVPQG